ncbi:hypothetical protein SASPL_108571 [Salvia splendens]|uniref:Uncharacterized protein n=1 Tax=Salvia splendens TaxID=180675 RepID=A0A8X8YIH9_SALSN|nr:hypothetical protein SASPL_108571 [Salvia splendens]
MSTTPTSSSPSRPIRSVDFVWVIRPSMISCNDIDVLPEGFGDMIERKGLVVSWCNQMSVFANPVETGDREIDLGVNLCDGESLDMVEIAGKIKGFMSGAYSERQRQEASKLKVAMGKARWKLMGRRIGILINLWRI